jgi:hypothetical protein
VLHFPLRPIPWTGVLNYGTGEDSAALQCLCDGGDCDCVGKGEVWACPSAALRAGLRAH